MEEMKITSVTDVEVLSTLVHTEIDIQIATAKKYPRAELAVIIKKIEDLVFLSEDITESCAYALPRKERDKKTNQWTTKIISGPSVRFAEIVAHCYGNIRCGARVVGNDGRKITSQGFCHDLESNVFAAFEVQRKITTSTGQTYSEDMQIITGNAASKIAYRVGIFSVIPAALVAVVFDKVLKKIKGKEEDLPQRREKAISWFTSKGVTDIQIFEVLGIKNAEQIDLEKLQILSGMKTSINTGEFTVEELFPPIDDKNKNKAGAATETTLGLFDGQDKKTNGKKK